MSGLDDDRLVKGFEKKKLMLGRLWATRSCCGIIIGRPSVSEGGGKENK